MRGTVASMVRRGEKCLLGCNSSAVNICFWGGRKLTFLNKWLCLFCTETKRNLAFICFVHLFPYEGCALGAGNGQFRENNLATGRPWGVRRHETIVQTRPHIQGPLFAHPTLSSGVETEVTKTGFWDQQQKTGFWDQQQKTGCGASDHPMVSCPALC